MNNPFDDEHAPFRVLVNADVQYSLWPVAAQIPNGWRVSFGPASRSECLEYVDQTWTDLKLKNSAQS
jgi:MbtH protein